MVACAITNKTVDPTIRPPKDSPMAVRKRLVGPCFVYGKKVESFGGSVVAKAAIVVRSRPACKSQEGFCRVKTEGTYNDVRVLDALS